MEKIGGNNGDRDCKQLYWNVNSNLSNLCLYVDLFLSASLFIFDKQSRNSHTGVRLLFSVLIMNTRVHPVNSASVFYSEILYFGCWIFILHLQRATLGFLHTHTYTHTSPLSASTPSHLLRLPLPPPPPLQRSRAAQPRTTRRRRWRTSCATCTAPWPVMPFGSTRAKSSCRTPRWPSSAAS